MAYRLRLNIRNPGTQQRQVVIHGGTVFEATDPFSRYQNLVAAGTTSVTIAPGQSRAVVIDTWCLNRSFAPPSNTPMQPTVLATQQSYGSQAALWDDMSRRR